MSIKLFSRPVLAAGLLAAGAGLAFAAAPVTTVETGIGAVLADAEGMTLYTFRNDAEGVSNCYDSCAVNWPPFFAEDGAVAEGAFTLVTRDDGGVQWALDGWPLYYWIGDSAPGDTSGHGVGGNWDAARPGDDAPGDGY